MDNFVVRLLRDDPWPLWLATLPEVSSINRTPFEWAPFLSQLAPNLLGCAFRSVNLSRLPTVLANGIDVEPTDSVIYADCFDKAWEYGDWPKLILALDYKGLQKSFVRLPKSTAPEKVIEVQSRYPTLIDDCEADSLWLSRLPIDDPRVASGYEVAYGYWIEGDPHQTLMGAILFADTMNLEQILGSANVS